MLLRRYKDRHDSMTTAPEVKSDAATSPLTVKELKALLDEKGIEYDAKAKKEDLVKLLEGAE